MVCVDWSLGVERKVRDVVTLPLYREEDLVLATGNNVAREMDAIVDMAGALRVTACQ